MSGEIPEAKSGGCPNCATLATKVTLAETKGYIGTKDYVEIHQCNKCGTIYKIANVR